MYLFVPSLLWFFGVRRLPLSLSPVVLWRASFGGVVPVRVVSLLISICFSLSAFNQCMISGCCKIVRTVAIELSAASTQSKSASRPMPPKCNGFPLGSKNGMFLARSSSATTELRDGSAMPIRIDSGLDSFIFEAICVPTRLSSSFRRLSTNHIVHSAS
mgnify:CR=1 FL=1